MSRSKKLVREFKGTLAGALAGFIYRSLKGDRSGANKIKSAAISLAPSVEASFRDLEKSVAQHAKDSEKRIKKLPADQQANIRRLAKKFESKHVK